MIDSLTIIVCFEESQLIQHKTTNFFSKKKNDISFIGK